MNIDLELARIVADDIDFLLAEWRGGIDDASLRRTSPVLRYLLVEGQLGRIANQATKPLRVLAPAIARLMTKEELTRLKFYQAGGARFNGVEIQSVLVHARALSAGEVKANHQRTRDAVGKSYPVKLGQFLRQTSFVVDGVLISREEVIKYVANKLGGAHYDSSRSSQPEGRESTLGEKYRLLDRVRSGTTVGDKNAIYYELLSIGQRVANSRDVRALRKHLKLILQRSPVVVL